MNSNSDRKTERLEKILKIQTIRRQLGRKPDPIHGMMEEFAASGLDCSDAVAERELQYWQGELIAQQLRPPVVTVPPLPADGQYVVIGNEVTTGRPVCVPLYGLCCGMIGIGTNGSGKTVLLATIIHGVPETVSIYAPDSKREICRILKKSRRKWLYVRPCERYVNILDCPTKDPHAYYLALLSMLAHLMELEDATWPEIASILAGIRQAVPAGSPMIALSELPNLLEKIGQQRKKGKFLTAAAKFRLLSMSYGDAARTRRGIDLTVRYSAVGMDYSGQAHMIRHVTDSEVLFRHIQKRAISGHGSPLKLLFVSDEGLDFFSKAFTTQPGSGRISIQDILTAQGRSYGIGRVTGIQWLNQADDSVIANSNTVIILRLPDYADARKACRAVGLPEEMASEIQNLTPGEGYWKSDLTQTALRIRIPFCDLGAYPSDTELSTLMEPEIRFMRENAILAPALAPGEASDINYSELLGSSPEPIVVSTVAPVSAAPVPPAPVTPIRLIADWAAFLAGVEANPDVNTSGLYSALKLSGYRGTKIKTELLDAGLIIVERVITTGRPAERIRITSNGKQSLEDFKRHEKGT